MAVWPSRSIRVDRCQTRAIDGPRAPEVVDPKHVPGSIHAPIQRLVPYRNMEDSPTRRQPQESLEYRQLHVRRGVRHPSRR
jgi:hypothetical protein